MFSPHFPFHLKAVLLVFRFHCFFLAVSIMTLYRYNIVVVRKAIEAVHIALGYLENWKYPENWFLRAFSTPFLDISLRTSYIIGLASKVFSSVTSCRAPVHALSTQYHGRYSVTKYQVYIAVGADTWIAYILHHGYHNGFQKFTLSVAYTFYTGS